MGASIKGVMRHPLRPREVAKNVIEYEPENQMSPNFTQSPPTKKMPGDGRRPLRKFPYQIMRWTTIETFT